ncbi:probable glutathione S-transferase [Macadamia integrifolia]|uniref:probable glutathione S-transferase n=1 Tax=Macadamia integrifolia TaxID=60698 RepID=UPI001C4F284D|nr:probable glutathione S-transferase [Macadamia integrifolia]
MGEELKLFGYWSSPFSCRVKWALKLKGLDYEYIEEDLFNKSALLLQYNPIYKKIPVLVHGGKPVVESIVILQYIEETWPENPLLPTDPYERAVARFWTKFAEDKTSSIWSMFHTVGEKQEKAIKGCLEMLRTIEEHGLGEKKFFGGETIGLADLAFGWIAHWLGVLEDLLDQKWVDAHTFPRLHAWIQNFREVSVIKENLPDRDQMFLFYKCRMEKLSASASN